MGYRTVIILNDDLHHFWANDANLGNHIGRAATKTAISGNAEIIGNNYGRVVECVHADTQTLGFLDSFSFVRAASQHSSNNITNEQKLDLLRAAAAELGYTLRKIRATQPKGTA